VPRGAFVRRPLPEVLDEWVSVRNATLSLVRAMPSEGWTRCGRVNDARISAAALAYVMLGHVEHHLVILHDRYGVERA